jgi:hypothetical protein
MLATLGAALVLLELVAGRSMPAFLGGSASTFETERVKSHTSFGLFRTYFKGAFLPSRYGVHGDSIWGCPRAAPALQCAQ